MFYWKDKMKNKRGQGLPISTIILIILGVLVLVALVIGFSMGWEGLMPWLNNGDNVETVMAQCRVACTQRNSFDFCEKKINITAEDKEYAATCLTYSTDAIYTKFGIDDCTGLCTRT